MEMSMPSTSAVLDNKSSHGDKPSHDDGPFPFLRLPKDLRLMVYDRLPIVTRHHTHLMQWPECELIAGIDSSMTIVTKSVPGVVILATCHLVNSEASSIVAKKLEDVRAQPTKLLGDDLQWSRRTDLIWSEVDIYTWENTGRPFVEFVEKCAKWELKGRPISKNVDASVEVAINLEGMSEDLHYFLSMDISQTMFALPRSLHDLRQDWSRACPKRTIHARIKFSGPAPTPWEQNLALRVALTSTPDTGFTGLSEEVWRDDWVDGAESL